MPSSQPQRLSLELSVRAAVPVRRKDLLFGRRVLSDHGKACLCTGDIFPRIPGDYKTAPRTPHSRARSRTQISVQPPSGLGARGDAGATEGAKPTSSSFSSSAPRGKEPAWPTAETWFPAAFAGFAAMGEISRELWMR